MIKSWDLELGFVDCVCMFRWFNVSPVVLDIKKELGTLELASWCRGVLFSLSCSCCLGGILSVKHQLLAPFGSASESGYDFTSVKSQEPYTGCYFRMEPTFGAPVSTFAPQQPTRWPTA